jgi:hypothetical protein
MITNYEKQNVEDYDTKKKGQNKFHGAVTFFRSR